MKTTLNKGDREAQIAPLLAAGWAMVQDRDALCKTYRFADFADAFGWMTRVAIWSDKWDHHPEWCNVYNRVVVTLMTHDTDGITALDIRLARKMDQLAVGMVRPSKP